MLCIIHHLYLLLILELINNFTDVLGFLLVQVSEVLKWTMNYVIFPIELAENKSYAVGNHNLQMSKALPYLRLCSGHLLIHEG